MFLVLVSDPHMYMILFCIHVSHWHSCCWSTFMFMFHVSAPQSCSWSFFLFHVHDSGMFLVHICVPLSTFMFISKCMNITLCFRFYLIFEWNNSSRCKPGFPGRHHQCCPCLIHSLHYKCWQWASRHADEPWHWAKQRILLYIFRL